MKKVAQVSLFVLMTAILGGCNLFGLDNEESEKIENQVNSQEEVSEVDLEQQAKRDRDRQRSSDLDDLSFALRQYSIDNGGEVPNTNLSGLESFLVPEYIDKIPNDPSPFGKYFYFVTEDTFAYVVTAWSEEDTEVKYSNSFGYWGDDDSDAFIEKAKDDMGPNPF